MARDGLAAIVALSPRVVGSCSGLSLLLMMFLSLFLSSSRPDRSCCALTISTPFEVRGGNKRNRAIGASGGGKNTHYTFTTQRSRRNRNNLLLLFASPPQSSPSSSHSPPSPPSPVPPFSMNNDSEEEVESIRSWKSTSTTASKAEVVYRAPSLLGENAFVEAKKRTHGGWHTLGIVGGPTKSIYHGVFRKNETTGRVDPYALGPSEYIRTMASVSLCLSAVVVNSNENDHRLEKGRSINDSLSSTSATSTSTSTTTIATPLRFLHMGYGSGSLMRFLRHAIAGSQHEAIELDPTVVEAAVELGLWDPASSRERVRVGDALEYCSGFNFHDGNGSSDEKQSQLLMPFQGICIDVFDGSNLMPPAFYSVPFLEALRDKGLENENNTDDGGCCCCCSFVVHNFHVGTDRLQAQLEDAMVSYRAVFGTTDTKNNNNKNNNTSGKHHHSLYRVDSLTTNNHGGNTILIAIQNNSSNNSNNDVAASDSSSSSHWSEWAALATERWKDNRFDVASRVAHARPF